MGLFVMRTHAWLAQQLDWRRWSVARAYLSLPGACKSKYCVAAGAVPVCVQGSAHLQAAEAGNAEKVAKARKRKKRKAEDEQMLASDNEDYAPQAGQEGQVEDLGEEQEWQGGDASDQDGQQDGNEGAVLHTGAQAELSVVAWLA